MASHPPGKCCYTGVIHEGTARGTMKRLGDFEYYLAEPASPSKKGILILTDVIGHGFINVQLIADQFAANGYIVVMPDLFDGDPVPLNRPDGFDLTKWKREGRDGQNKGHMPTTVDPIVDACLVEMRTQMGLEKIGAVGYCFGGKYVVRHLRPAEGKVDVGYTAHPSFVDEDELKDMRGPLAISAAGEFMGSSPSPLPAATFASFLRLGRHYSTFRYIG